MDRNVLNDVINILYANIEKVHGIIITHNGVITNAYGMNKYEYFDRIVFSNEYINNIILEYKDIKSITMNNNNIKYESNNRKRKSR